MELVILTAQMVGIAAMQGSPNQIPADMPLPLFVAMDGLMLPSLSAVHSLIVERETRSLELMVALP